jgi:hypothetical protein
MAVLKLQYDHSVYSLVTNPDGTKALHCAVAGVADIMLSGANTYAFADHWNYNAANGQWGIVATATNQAFVIPNAVNPVQSITGKFAGGSVVLGHGHDSYQIVRNANGTLTVTDTVHGTLKNAVISGIGALKFSDGLSYDTTSARMVQLGSSGNDTMTVIAGAQVVDGGGGINTAVFAKSQSAYRDLGGAWRLHRARHRHPEKRHRQ